MDGSGSELRAFFNMIDISKQLAGLLAIGPQSAHVAQVRFASAVRSRIDYGFNKYYNKTELIDVIDKTHVINGTTNIDRALELAVEVFQNQTYGARSRKRLFFLSYPISISSRSFAS